MKSAFLKKIIAATVVSTTLITLMPISASADWRQIDGYWYYFNNGYKKTGWIIDGGSMYYTDAKGEMQTGVVQINGNIYLFSPSGAMQTGQAMIGNEIYTFDGNGIAIGNKLPMPSKAFDLYGYSTVPYIPNQLVNGGGTPTDPVTNATSEFEKANELSVEFKDDDGESFRIKKIQKGDKIKLYKPKKDDYVFVEWNTKKNGNGTSYDYDEEIKVKNDMTLYAQWEDIDDEDNDGSSSDKVAVTDIIVTGEEDKNTITTNGGTLQMKAEILPVDASDDAVTWSVENSTGAATIDQDGLLTAAGNGTVIVKATAKDGSEVYGKETVTITGQTAGGGSGSGGSGSGSGSDGDGSDTEKPAPTLEDYTIEKKDDTTVNGSEANIKEYKTLAILRTDFKLKYVSATTLAVQGGGTLDLTGCKIKNLKINDANGTFKLIVDSNTTIENIEVNKGTTIESSGIIGNININTNEVVTIKGKVDSMNVNSAAKILLEGSADIGKVSAEAEAKGTIIAGEGHIGELTTKANIDLAVASVTSVSGTQNNSGSISLYKAKIQNFAELEKAILAVEKAEESRSDADIASATEMVNTLSSEFATEKTTLLARINQITDGKNEITKISEAKAAVEEAEQAIVVISKAENKVDRDNAINTAKTKLQTAKDKVNILTSTADKNNLLRRINKAEKSMNKYTELGSIINAIISGNFTGIDENTFINAGLTGVNASNVTDIITKLELISDEDAAKIKNIEDLQKAIGQAISDIAKEKEIADAKNQYDIAFNDAEGAVKLLYVGGVTTGSGATVKDDLDIYTLNNAGDKLSAAKIKLDKYKATGETEANINISQNKFDEINSAYKVAKKTLITKQVEALFTTYNSNKILASGVNKSKLDEVNAKVVSLQSDFNNDSDVIGLKGKMDEAYKLLEEKEKIMNELWNNTDVTGNASSYTTKSNSKGVYQLQVKLPNTKSYSVDSITQRLLLNSIDVFEYDSTIKTAKISLKIGDIKTSQIVVLNKVTDESDTPLAWKYNVPTSIEDNSPVTKEGYSVKFTTKSAISGDDCIFTITMTPQ